MNKLFKNRHIKISVRKKGATLLSVIILSVLVMSLLLGISRTIGQKIEFSADFFFGEKSYFAAESGAEKALLILKETPLKHGNIYVPFANDDISEIDLHIDNRSDAFSFVLEPFGSRKLRLQKNVFGTTYEPVDLDTLLMSIEAKEDQSFEELFLWSIQCIKETDDGRTTVSIQETSTEVNDMQIINAIGNYDDDSGSTQELFAVSTFWNTELSNDDERKSCFLSLQNLTESALQTHISSSGMAPEKATITSKGIAQTREKTIQFEYLQNNLSSFFNFGLLHTDN